ncbi:MAG TPA: ATP-binding protein [Rheinheimera sp.]|uniref:ATP-binding protein n=1 Tax=Rheinheimera sp. TaxID=1869214 RepID=UPI000EBE6810|nr:ATP-binding protein [Rheinheimera sp.]HCU64410.1 ATP-binding protein [Rheinheimera sp.]
MAKFRTKARAVDHLGKGQIADLPTAISELWKNGYDAYADEVSCDLYQIGYRDISEPVFTLSDDGFGMSEEELETKWIVLGTDSKTRGMLPLTEEARLSKEPRIPLGEKGIGRLSIAYLGSPILMLTKKKNEQAHLVYVDWRILENYNLYIEDFDIPIIPLNKDRSLNEHLDELTRQFSFNLSSGDWSEHESLAEQIKHDLIGKRLPQFLEDELETQFGTEENHGTSFVAFNPHPELAAMDAQDLDSKDNEKLNYLRTSLNGMTNAFKDEQPIATSFKIHHKNGMYDLVARNRFFTSHDVYHGDHWLKGEFNDEGEFKGSVQVYNENYDFFFKPNRMPGKTPYGPLTIELGWVEGVKNASKLPEKLFDILNKKLALFGGLYVYRDGFRVLPYGRLEYDWLKFEERRSRGAGYYHFSHRRMMGYIDISREKNPRLVDKAGREGFVANQAYHELQRDLIEFFIDVSLRFFRKTQGEDEPTSRQRQITDIEKTNKRLLKQEKRKSNITLTGFKREIKDNEESLGTLELTGTRIKESLQVQSAAKKVEIHQVEELLQELNDVKESLRKLRLVKPRRFNLDASLEKKYFEYCEKFEAASQIITECEEVSERLRASFSIETLENEYNTKAKSLRSSLVRQLQDFRKRIINSIDPIIETVDLDLSQVPGRFDIERSKLERAIGTAKHDYSLLQNELEKTADEFYHEQQERYLPLVKHLEGLDVGVDDDALVLWYKDQYEQIQEKVEAMHELSQLGIAVEIIDHQFNVLYSEIGNGLQTLKPLLEDHAEYQYSFKQLLSAFEHLETNHQLLAPLYRTTRRSRSEIPGEELFAYLSIFFKKRFEENNITFTCDKTFEEYRFFTFDSVIKPVFINLINNAIYWLKSVSDRTIHIKIKDDKILVQNNGQPIDNFYLEDIFKLFFTRTPGGRGIGLYLARTNLETIGYRIEASNDRKYNELKGACFIIEKAEGV